MLVCTWVWVVFFLFVFFNNCHPSFYFFAGKRISALATESYNSSVNYNRQKPSVIFCVQFSTFLYKCAIFYHFMNKPDQRDGCKRFVVLFIDWYLSMPQVTYHDVLLNIWTVWMLKLQICYFHFRKLALIFTGQNSRKICLHCLLQFVRQISEISAVSPFLQ